MKIIIFGGFGFVGSRLHDFLKTNYKVYRASRRNGYDINNTHKIKKFLKKINPDYIINCAVTHGGLHYINLNPANIFSENSLIYFNLYKAVAESKRKKNFCMINLISNCAYTDNVKIQKENEWLNSEPHESVLPFAIPKRIAFYLSKFYEKQYKIRSKNFIIPNAYGPGDYLDPQRTHALNGIIIRFIKTINEKKSFFSIWGSGKPKREWIYVDDIAKLISIEIKKNKIKTCYPLNLGQNKSYSILQICNIVKKILNSQTQFRTDLKRIDGAIIKKLCNKQFRIIFKNYIFEDIQKGIKKTILYYKSKL
jgi:nucleoside-diphosphate-sugar epimerase